MRILIVEDDLISRRLLQRISESHGVCDVVVDGEEAVKAFEIAHGEKSPYDLILLDIRMPKLDGREALARIRAIEANFGIGGLERVKVIMTTAHSDPENIIGSFFDSECDAYITKPFTREALDAEMRKVSLID
jgi:two-component system, chemotaxis family, chemotaxis protein CheY